MFYFDNHGWLVPVGSPDRSTEIDPGFSAAPVEGELYPNFTGEAWVMQPYTTLTSQPGIPALFGRRISLGALQERLGNMRVFAIDTSLHPVCVALRSYLGRLNFIDLDDPRLSAMLDMLVSNSQPEANPVFPGSGPLTAEEAAEIMAAPVQPQEVP